MLGMLLCYLIMQHLLIFKCMYCNGQSNLVINDYQNFVLYVKYLESCDMYSIFIEHSRNITLLMISN